jgi:hypothetical protein
MFANSKGFGDRAAARNLEAFQRMLPRPHRPAKGGQAGALATDCFGAPRINICVPKFKTDRTPLPEAHKISSTGLFQSLRQPGPAGSNLWVLFGSGFECILLSRGRCGADLAWLVATAI